MDEPERQLAEVRWHFERDQPPPVQAGGPPIIMGGSAGPRGAALAARHADEYNTVFATTAECRERRARIADACRDAGSEPIPFSLMTGFHSGHLVTIGCQRPGGCERVGAMRRSALLLPLTLLFLLTAAPARGDFDPDARVDRSQSTGKVRFVGMPAGEADRAPTESSPAAAGRAYLRDNERAFGLRGSGLRAIGRERAAKGGTAVRFQQVVDGVEVLGGQFAVQLTEGNRVRSVLGEALPEADGVDTAPGVSATAARQAAIAVTARDFSISAVRLTASNPALRIFDARIMGGPGPRQPRLVWETVVGSDHGLVAERVFVDARKGHVAESITEIHEARDRRVCDAANTASHYPCTAPVLTEGGTYSGAGAVDVQPAYDYAGATYDYFFNRFGRDSLDGKGLPLKSTVRVCPPGEPCPYENAFWSGTDKQMAYGQGFAAADDVVGHELAHGLTDFTSGLYYYFQSGAINESISDVFGELIDLQTASPDDDPGDRWLLGETIGAIRDMENPPAFNDPDRMGSTLFWKAEGDRGGVHINSGVNNKAAFLITDGGSFNGQTVTGLGADKAAALYYEVATGFLTSASDYYDLGNALSQACANLVGSAGLTSADCTEVGDAVAATEMLTNDGGSVDTPACTTAGQGPTYSYFDDFEGDALSRWVPRTIIGAAGWYLADDTPYGDLTYATSGEQNLFGDNSGERRDGAIEMASPVVIPSNGRLIFRHAHGFEDGPGFYDGGVVEYSTNGTDWSDVPGMPYTGTISTSFDNPLAGRSAFVAESLGYITTVVPLTSLAGQSVRLRFRIGEDTGFWDEGWHVDDLGIFTCGADSAPPETTLTQGPADGSASTDGAPVFAFESSEKGSKYRCRFTGSNFRPCYGPQAFELADGTFAFEVKAIDPSGNEDPTPAVSTFTVDRVEPDTSIVSGPADGGTTTQTQHGFAFGASEPGVVFECRLDGGAFAECPANFTTPVLGPGGHRLDVRSRDRAGNVDPSPAGRGFTIVEPPPAEFELLGTPRVKGNRVTFGLQIPEAGKVRAKGKAKIRRRGRSRNKKVAVKRATFDAARQTVVTAKLNRRGRRARKRQTVKARFVLKFTPVSGQPAQTIKVTVKFKGKRRR